MGVLLLQEAQEAVPAVQMSAAGCMPAVVRSVPSVGAIVPICIVVNSTVQFKFQGPSLIDNGPIEQSVESISQ